MVIHNENWMPAVFRNELEFSGIKGKLVTMRAFSAKVRSHQLGKPGKADAGYHPWLAKAELFVESAWETEQCLVVILLPKV